MNQLLLFIKANWFAVVLVVLALLPGALLLRGFLRGQRSLVWLLAGATLLLAGIGGMTLDPEWGLWTALAAVGVFFVMFGILVLTGHWWAPLAYAVAAVLVVGLGGLTSQAAGDGLAEACQMLLSLEAGKPWWLLLLLCVPLTFWFSYRSLAGLGPVRRWVALGLRCVLLALVPLALAETRIRHENETVTVLFLVDKSFSVPQETYEDPGTKGKFGDHRWDRLRKFINDAVEKRGSGHERDKAGLIVFGRKPRLELPPSDAPRFQLSEIASSVDGNYTDIAAAIKLALASFPEGTGKRIVLLSDGNENMGNAEEQAQLAKQNGVQIDVVPLAAGQRNENEVMVQSVEAPPIAEQGSQLPIRVLIRSHNPNPVRGELKVSQLGDPNTGGQSIVIDQRKVTVNPGLTSFTFKQPLGARQQSYTYEAEFVPEGVVVGPDRLVPIIGDRVQNNRATTHVVARSQRKVLLVEQNEGDHRMLERELRDRKIDILSLKVDTLPKDKDKLGVFLSNFDCVVLANLPADTLTEEQQEMIRSNTHEQGCGLVMIGGPDSFGAGGWQNTPVEKALPVDSEIKSLKVQGKGGLVMIMHASEMAEGNYWQKKIAKLAIEKLSSIDEVGVLHFDWGVHKWHIPLQEIGEKRAWLLSQVDKLQPGDMPDFDGPLQMAHKALADPAKDFATRHVIIISDGDPQLTNRNILTQMQKDKISITTVGVATHGAPMDQALANIAIAVGGRGRYYKVTSANMLPAIYIKETRLVSQAFTYEKRFQPNVVFRAGPTEGLGEVNPLYGFVRTTPKPSPLVELPIKSPPINEQEFPILAYWHYGLGKSVAFTSDARSKEGVRAWDRDWAGSEMYAKFWEQVVDWVLRPTESKNLTMTTEYRDGKVKVIIDARDDKNRPLDTLELRGGVTAPSKGEASRIDLRFEQTNAGVYVAEFKADEAGSYFLNAQAWEIVRGKDGKPVIGKDGMPLKEARDGVRAGVTIPYSPEYSDLESNTALLRRLAEITGGKVYLEKPREEGPDGGPVPSYEVVPEDAEPLEKVAARGEVFRRGLPVPEKPQPIWHWLLFAAGVLLLFDVGTRRIALEFGAVATAAVAVWDRLRGRMPAPEKQAEYLDRLRSRKAAVSEALKQPKAARRFEAEEGAPAATPPPGADVLPKPAEPAPPPAPRPKTTTAEEADYLSRLKKAKKRAMQEHEKDKEE